MTANLRSFLPAVVLPLPLFLAAGVLASRPDGPNEAKGASLFDVNFHAALDPASESARVRMEVEQPSPLVREFRFRVDPARHRDFSADGELKMDPPFAIWRPPSDGGELRYTVRINRKRGGDSYDARVTDRFAILRLGHLFPPARVRLDDGAKSRSRLTIEAPDGWSVETRYGPMQSQPLDADNPERLYSRPTGWLIAGDLGLRRESIAGRQVAVAGPVDEGVRRMDMLAMIHLTLPELIDVFPRFPDRLLVVGADDPMWRGALSGPDSLYIHADRPLLNERGTSTLVHEMVHVAGITGAGPGDDWIVEGLCDYYSLQVLRRAGILSESRYQRSLSSIERFGSEISTLAHPSANSRIASRAFGELAKIDKAIQEASGGKASLDDVARRLAEGGETITLALFREIAEEVAGQELPLFDELPLGETSD